ncbi:hypothetical protein EW145_g7682 [Phellinidium pouzarii]|uniref:C2H2-type domain-containing protein n=1 Tax=Phellinidium pouzarii TaxID=167371 RepID=A0A4S4KK45_9AGAM|nr:hypothetical protein EW145_g7682 [Phellinidium pouzarii]
MFTTETGLEKHLFDSPKHPKCRPCHLGFKDIEALSAHKANVHHDRTRKRGRRQRSFSPVGSASDSLTSSPSSPWAAMMSAAVSAGSSDGTSQLQFTPTPSPTQYVASPRNSAEPLQREESPAPSSATVSECSRQSSRMGSPLTVHVMKDRDGTSSPHRSLHTPVPIIVEPQPSPKFWDVDEAETDKDLERSPLGLDFMKHQVNFLSPLLDANVPLVSDAFSDTSADDDDVQIYAHSVQNLATAKFQNFGPGSDHVDSKPAEPSRGRSLDSSLLSRRTSMLTEDMKASWRARCAAATNISVSPVQYRLNTLHALSPLQSPLSRFSVASEDSDTDSHAPLILDTSPIYRRLTGLRKRRLSLSPTLPSIPETTHVLSPVEPIDSDSESSLGIFEHHADDFLYDGELDEDARDGDDSKSISEGSCPSPPPLIIEDLTQLAREMCTSPYDNDPFADPFNLHPSCSNSPMDATFVKRPRAWSIGPPEPEPVAPADGESDFEDRRGFGAEEADDDASSSVDGLEQDDIRDDLFSEAHESDDDVDAEGEMQHTPTAARFVEEGHLLRSRLSLDNSKVSRQSSSGPLLPPPSPGHEEMHTQSDEASSRDIGPQRPGLKMHCRICYDDPCRDIAATFCGHIFCYGKHGSPGLQVVPTLSQKKTDEPAGIALRPPGSPVPISLLAEPPRIDRSKLFSQLAKLVSILPDDDEDIEVEGSLRYAYALSHWPPLISRIPALTRHNQDFTVEASDMLFCSTSPCKILLPVWAQALSPMHQATQMQYLFHLAKRLNRTLVLPNVGHPSNNEGLLGIGTCNRHPFARYFDVSTLLYASMQQDSYNTQKEAVLMQPFLEWVKYRFVRPSAQIFILDSKSSNETLGPSCKFSGAEVSVDELGIRGRGRHKNCLSAKASRLKFQGHAAFVSPARLAGETSSSVPSSSLPWDDSNRSNNSNRYIRPATGDRTEYRSSSYFDGILTILGGDATRSNTAECLAPAFEAASPSHHFDFSNPDVIAVEMDLGPFSSPNEKILGFPPRLYALATHIVDTLPKPLLVLRSHPSSAPAPVESVFLKDYLKQVTRMVAKAEDFVRSRVRSSSSGHDITTAERFNASVSESELNDADLRTANMTYNFGTVWLDRKLSLDLETVMRRARSMHFYPSRENPTSISESVDDDHLYSGSTSEGELGSGPGDPDIHPDPEPLNPADIIGAMFSGKVFRDCMIANLSSALSACSLSDPNGLVRPNELDEVLKDAPMLMILDEIISRRADRVLTLEQ